MERHHWLLLVAELAATDLVSQCEKMVAPTEEEVEDQVGEQAERQVAELAELEAGDKEEQVEELVERKA